MKGGKAALEYLPLEYETVRVSTLYNKEADLKERIERRDRIWEPEDPVNPTPSGSKLPDSNMILVDKKEYKELKQKSATLDKVLMLLKGQTVTGIVKLTGTSPGTIHDEGQGSKKGQKGIERVI